MQRGLVHAATGAAHVVAVPAAAAAQLGVLEHAVGQRAAAGRAGGPVGVGAAVQAHEQHALAGHLAQQRLAAAEVGHRPRRRPRVSPPRPACAARRRSRAAAAAAGPAGAAPSASMPSMSGAALWIASSMASLSVTADDGQPLQLPSRRRWATPPSRPSSSTSPPWDSRYGPDLLERPAHARLQRHRVQPVQQQQVGDELVAAQRGGQRAVVARGDVGRRSAPAPRRRRRAAPARPRQRLVAGDGVRQALDLLQQRLDARDPLAGRAVVQRQAGLSHAHRTSASAPGGSSCPCPGTCAPRRAGTGRSCGPRA